MKIFKCYYFASNLLSNSIFVLFAKCLHSLQLPGSNGIIVLFSILALISIVITFQFIACKTSTTWQYQLIEYGKNIPLAIVSFYYFSTVSYQQSTEKFNLYFLLICSIFFSFISILNCVLFEVYPILDVKILLFKFLFRYFHFIAKIMGLILFFSTQSDDLTSDSAYLIPLVLVLYISILFLIYSIWYLIKIDMIEFDPFKMIEICFEAYKMILEYNEKYFEKKSYLNVVKIILVLLCDLLVQATGIYFWFFKAIFLYTSIQNKTTLLSLITTSNNRIALINLIELEEKSESGNLN